MGARLHRLGIHSGISTFVMIIAMLTAGYISAAPAGEEDLVKKLIGRWEGVMTAGSNQKRFLVVESIKDAQTHWTAYGRYGIEGTGGKVEMRVTVSGNDVTVDFDTPGKLSARVKLEGDNELNGHVRVFEPGQRSYINVNLKLKRVQ